MEISPFRLRIEDSVLEDLRDRLSRTRWTREPDDTTGLGESLGPMRRLVDYWRTGFDWRALEDRVNAWPGFRARVGGLRIHFLHARGRGPAPFPLVVTHGWPGSFLEMLKILPLLVDPGSHEADPDDAFDVVVPSLPGYGFSESPKQRGMSPQRIAALWAELLDGLGYDRFGAQGGDWGAAVSTWLARQFSDRVAGIHLNYIPGSYAPSLSSGESPTEEEEHFLQERNRWREESGAYGHLQATRPQTLAFALNDSPVGLAAWIVEKFREWSDCGGDVEKRFTKDKILANVTLYWVTGSIASSMRLYAEGRSAPLRLDPGERIAVPCGVARFPLEIPMPPRSWVERGYNVLRWAEFPSGGHFAAMEEPELLAHDIREFFRPLRR